MYSDIDNVMESLIVAMEKYLGDERLPNMTAKYMMSFYRALQREGFTDEQAIDIVCKTPLPSPKS